VGSPYGAHPALDFEAVERIQAPLDGDQVVDLVELDVAAEVAEGGRDLALRLAVVRGPDLGGDDGPVSTVLSQGLAEHPLGLAVHR
jgi:hypothetical protein